MTAQFLSAELSNLIQESKKKNTELRTAAEKSLKDLKALPSTSEAQVAADLSRRPNFISPFLIACSTRNARFAGTAVLCLQRLVVSRGLPKERLKEVLEAFRESTSLGLDIQLKILQALPSLLQNYPEELVGDLLNKVLEISFVLQSNKNAVVSNTAAATLQQLVVSVFDQVVIEDKNADRVPTIGEAASAEGPIPLRAAALDAVRLFGDLCLLVDARKPQFLRTSSLQQSFGLELIESVLTNHADIFQSHPEQAHVLQKRLMPYAIKSLSNTSNFPVSIRIFRVLYNILRYHLSMLKPECGTVLSLMTRLLEPEITLVWKRALCMEVFRGIHADPRLTREIYAHFDEQNESNSVFRDHMAALARLAAEKPTVIGLGKQSTVPIGAAQSKDSSTQQAAMEAGGVAGVIGAPVDTMELDVPGISAQWSTVRTPCIDQLDKSEAPNLPDSYIYSLVLTCINAFSEGLAKFILPLTITNDSRSKGRQRTPITQEQDTQSEVTENDSTTSTQGQESPATNTQKKSRVPLDPTTLTAHPQHSEIKISAAMIETCWPAVLATSSTFLYASLDSEYYHSLVRSFQKFTHVAGLLRLETPRDAFLTTLGNAALPADLLIPNAGTTPSTPSVEAQSLFQNARGLLSVESLVSHTASSVATDKHKQATDSSLTFLNARNMLCLRALLNLGIALGPTLGKAWSILLETLQQADVVISVCNHGTGLKSSFKDQKVENQAKQEGPAPVTNLGAEVMAVESAASRMFESTAGYPNDSFIEFISALCKLVGAGSPELQGGDLKSTAPMPLTPRTPSHSHRRIPSSTRLLTFSTVQSEFDQSVLLKLDEVAGINIARLTRQRPSDSGWDVIVGELVAVACSARFDNLTRLNATKVLDRLVLSAFSYGQSAGLHNNVENLGLSALRHEIQRLYDGSGGEGHSMQGVQTEIHQLILESLKSILEQWGDTLEAGWEMVFEIVSHTFDDVERESSSTTDQVDFLNFEQRRTYATTRSPKLVRPSFDCLRLICSDFLGGLSSSCILMLIDILFRFCSQTEDFNISLTTTAFFWNVSDFLQGVSEDLHLDSLVGSELSIPRLLDVARKKDLRAAAPALWLVLQMRLTAVTTDSRLEVRNGAVHTILRIFEAYGNRLTSSAWNLCLPTIVFKMMKANETEYVHSKGPESTEEPAETKPWNNTAIIIVHGVGKLFAAFLDNIGTEATFSRLWKNLIQHLDGYLLRQSLEVSAAVYQALRQILSKMRGTAHIETNSVDPIWELWSTHNPALVPPLDTTEGDNVTALTAYVECFRELSPLIEDTLTIERVKIILENLRTCVFNANTSTYSADVDNVTPLQTKVLDCIKLIRGNIAGVPSILVSLLADMVSKPFEDRPQRSGGRKSSFIALSKAAMDLMESIVTKHKEDRDLFTSGALTKSIDALVIPINLKYKWRSEGKEPSSWRKATSTAISILAEILPVLPKSSFDDPQIQELWTSVVTLTNAVTAGDCSSAPPTTNIRADEAFDIAAFTRLRTLITPSLGSPLLPDKTRQSYTSSIFTNSLIHTPHRQDLPGPHQEPLENLYATHMGRTYDPPPARRSRMSYLLVDELFRLVSIPHSDNDNDNDTATTERITLARAAAPYLILRAAVVLKAYIADQPLRGLVPQPSSQKRELIYIVRKSVALESEPRAIPVASGVRSQYKRHLHRLFPLVVRAVGVAGRVSGGAGDEDDDGDGDGSVLGVLREVLEEVGDGFGVG